MDEYLSDGFTVQNDLRQGSAGLPLLSNCKQNVRKNHSLDRVNKTLKMWQFPIFESDINESNFSLVDFKSRLNSGTACYHSVPKFLPACLLPMNI
jgi:hypothetical protein